MSINNVISGNYGIPYRVRTLPLLIPRFEPGRAYKKMRERKGGSVMRLAINSVGGVSLLYRYIMKRLGSNNDSFFEDLRGYVRRNRVPYIGQVVPHKASLYDRIV